MFGTQRGMHFVGFGCDNDRKLALERSFELLYELQLIGKIEVDSAGAGEIAECVVGVPPN
jgi:hypothetical protein